jgi:hypothetical protein
MMVFMVALIRKADWLNPLKLRFILN